jgi:hypothetical protein
MADDERNPEVAAWLDVEPLDDVTRRRLVSTALRETDAPPAPGPDRSSRAWRRVAVAAAVVVVLVGGIALLVAQRGGDTTTTASRADRTTLSPKAAGGEVAVGDFGDLDDAANLERLRAALRAEPAPAAGASRSESTGSPLAAAPDQDQACGGLLPDGTVTARATGTLDGRPATVLRVEGADGSGRLVALLADPCETRDLGPG